MPALEGGAPAALHGSAANGNLRYYPRARETGRQERLLQGEEHMNRLLVPAFIILAGALAPALAAAQDVAITNARIIVGSGPVIDSGTIIVKGGKIVSVTAGAAPTQGQVFFYFGRHVAAFAERFGSLGRVLAVMPVADAG